MREEWLGLATGVGLGYLGAEIGIAAWSVIVWMALTAAFALFTG